MNELRPAPEEHLYERIAVILDEARSRVARTVNTAMVHAYWLIGREIVEVEQEGAERAAYGEGVVKRVAARLSSRFGKGFSLANLKRMKQFYVAFPRGSALPADDAEKGSTVLSLSPGTDEGERGATPSSLSDRGADRALPAAPRVVPLPRAAPRSAPGREVDLVFYNRLLRCFVLVDLKLGKLTHQDLGQMQMYVNYFDRLQRVEHEAHTIGIVLCSEKNDAMVKITLPEDNAQIHAARYQMYLPSEEELRAELSREREEAERVLRLASPTTDERSDGAKQNRLEPDPNRGPMSAAAVRAHVPARTLRALLATSSADGWLRLHATLFS